MDFERRINEKGNYIANVTITQENLEGEFCGEGYEYVCEGDSLESAKLSVKDVIWESVELDGLLGRCLVEAIYHNEGEYVDSDEYVIEVKQVTFTSEPSRFVRWENKKPHIFTVNKDKSVVVIEETQTPI